MTTNATRDFPRETITHGDIHEDFNYQELDLIPIGPIEHVSKMEREKENYHHNRDSRSRERIINKREAYYSKPFN